MNRIIKVIFIVSLLAISYVVGGYDFSEKDKAEIPYGKWKLKWVEPLSCKVLNTLEDIKCEMLTIPVSGWVSDRPHCEDQEVEFTFDKDYFIEMIEIQQFEENNFESINQIKVTGESSYLYGVGYGNRVSTVEYTFIEPHPFNTGIGVSLHWLGYFQWSDTINLEVISTYENEKGMCGIKGIKFLVREILGGFSYGLS